MPSWYFSFPFFETDSCLPGSSNSPASASRVAGTTGVCQCAQLIFLFLVETGFHHIGQNGLNLLTLWSACLGLPKCWDYRSEPPHPAYSLKIFFLCLCWIGLIWKSYLWYLNFFSSISLILLLRLSSGFCNSLNVSFYSRSCNCFLFMLFHWRFFHSYPVSFFLFL